MSDRRLRRFLHLERPRAPGELPPEDAPAPTPGRFDGVERPARGAHPEPRTGVRLERFGPEPEPTIDLAETAEGARPFTRCARCGMDHPLFATTCAGCTASLDTPEQHAFNEALWAERQAEAAREAEGERARQARRAQDEVEEAAARRALGETLAREVGDRERARLGWGDGSGWGSGGWGRSGGWGGDGSWGGGGGFDATPLGVRLLRLIADPRWRLAAGIAGGALALGLLLAGLAGGRRALAAGLVLLALLLVPPGFRRRRW